METDSDRGFGEVAAPLRILFEYLGDRRGRARNRHSADQLTRANHRFAGPETMATKIFARLSAWQNWIFIRPNASGPDGALKRYGTGSRPDYSHTRT